MTPSTERAGARLGGASQPGFFEKRRLSVLVGAAIPVAIAIGSVAIYGQGEGAKLSLSLVFGGLFGFILQRSRFCFYCMFRDWLDRRDPRGLLGLLLALAVGVSGYTIVFGAWLPDSGTGRFPPDAFIGPVGPMLVIAGLAFGAGMSLSGSCVSAHLYRLGEGSPTAPFALLGTGIGTFLGFSTWSLIYTSLVQPAPVVWLPSTLGYTGALLLGLASLALIALVLMRLAQPQTQQVSANPSLDLWSLIFVHRWPAWVGGLAIGALATAAYLRVGPLGVTAEIGARSRQVATNLGLLPTRIEGLDTLRGCVVAVGDALLSPNGAFVAALVLGSFGSALIAGQFQPTRPRLSHISKGLAGGLLLGWGAMTGLGCTVGTLLSGIMAGALSGWVFGAAVFFGAAVLHRRERPALSTS